MIDFNMHFVNAKSILNGSSFHCGMNIYRGCTHGCIYCDSRSTCYHFTHAFEDIEVKENAPCLLEEALKKKRRRCMIGTGAMTDPYIPLEKEIKLTRRCLEIIEKYGFGIAIQTKSDLILRDLDILKRINEKSKAVVQMTLTTFDDDLCKILEPAVCVSSRRFEVLKTFHEEGIPTVVWLSPFLPFINDTRENLEGLVDYCCRAGVKAIICFGIGLTLREGNREYFYEALERAAKKDRRFIGMKEAYIKTFGNSYIISSPRHTELMKRLAELCKEKEILLGTDSVFKWMESFPEEDPIQLSLF